MIIEFNQMSNDMYYRTYEILNKNKQIGSMYLQAHLGKIKTEIVLNIWDTRVEYVPIKSFKINKTRSCKTCKVILGGFDVGKLYSIIVHDSFLHSHSEIWLELNDKKYRATTYFQDNAMYTSIYDMQTNLQIAEVEDKGNTDDSCHKKRIYALNKELSIIATMIIVEDFYNLYCDGESITNSVKKWYYHNNSRIIANYYNPSFRENIRND
jgi:hypothetical protein